jgi:radical SAM superfamily enzyme YgiQ (UPF0313 family)
LNIVLVYPYFLEARIHVEEIAAIPMGLYYVGAMLKAHGHSVDIVNWHRRQDSMDPIKETLISKHPDIIGFSIVHANRWGAIDIAGLAKRIDPQVTVVVGGIGATFLWRHLLTHFEQIDYAVLGEGERTFLHLIEALEQNASLQQISEISGLALRNGADIMKTPPAHPIEDLDCLPPPARYFDFQHLSITRGCPGRCTFCGSPGFWGRRVRAHSARYFVNQLALLSRRGITFFYFSDDTFTLDSDLVIDICRRIVESGLDIRWQAISRVNAVNERMLRWMRKAGCVQISYGVESGSDRIRRLLCKDIGPRQIRRAFSLTIANGILARAYFIYGAPTESWATVEQTLELIRTIRPLSAVFYIMTLFPGTALYDDFKKRTGMDDDIWLQRIEDILYFEHDPDLDQETVLAFGRHLRSTYQCWLPQFARQIELNADPDLEAAQAGFLSRLGMTFSHGDYATLDGQTDTSQVALELFERALRIYPDHRAYWGTALVYQRRAAWERAAVVLRTGLSHFPGSEELAVCLGISLIHLGRFKQALDHLLPHAHSDRAAAYIDLCRRELTRSG